MKHNSYYNQYADTYVVNEDGEYEQVNEYVERMNNLALKRRKRKKLMIETTISLVLGTIAFILMALVINDVPPQ